MVGCGWLESDFHAMKNVSAPVNLFSFEVKMRHRDFLDFGKKQEKETSCSSLKLSLSQAVVFKENRPF